MNYLAHLLLSGEDPQWMMGGFLGDFVKGPLDPVPCHSQGQPWSQAVINGMRLHRAIDHFVDQHPLYLQALARLGPGLRRAGGIALDIGFDYFLANQWQRFASPSLADYSQQVYRLFSEHEPMFPQSARVFSERMREADLLQAYRDRQTLEQVLLRVEMRLKRPALLRGAYQQIVKTETQLQDDFLELMPVLMEFAEQRRHRLLLSGS